MEKLQKWGTSMPSPAAFPLLPLLLAEDNPVPAPHEGLGCSAHEAVRAVSGSSSSPSTGKTTRQVTA